MWDLKKKICTHKKVWCRRLDEILARLKSRFPYGRGIKSSSTLTTIIIHSVQIKAFYDEYFTNIITLYVQIRGSRKTRIADVLSSCLEDNDIFNRIKRSINIFINIIIIDITANTKIVKTTWISTCGYTEYIRCWPTWERTYTSLQAQHNAWLASLWYNRLYHLSFCGTAHNNTRQNQAQNNHL